jgi:hypothetical protein
MDAVIKRFAIVMGIVALAGCSNKFQGSQQAATALSSAVGCNNFQTRFWDQMYKTAEFETRLMSLNAVRKALQQKLMQAEPDPTERILRVQNTAEAIVAAISVVDQTLNPGDRILSREERMGKVAALELGVADSADLLMAKNRLATVVPQIETTRSLLHLDCLSGNGGVPTPSADDNPFYEQLKKSRMPAAYGAMKTMSTAYQRCDLPKFNLLTRSVPALQGITIGGTNSSGGTLRRITDLAALQQSHPYLQGFNLINNSCFDVRAKPLIYDFGGKPYATSDATSPLDFFTKQSTGSGALGIDCSGFVFSALASAGLKLKSTAALRASQVYLYGSSAYNNPVANGLDCIQPVQMTAETTLRAGDIVAGSGHVILIDSVGVDPFGISNIQSLKGCDSQINSNNFNFTISQSSASQGGIGINRYVGSEYLAGVSAYKVGLERIARYACYSKFQKQGPPPLSTINLVRHAGTPQCVAQEISLARSSCVSACVE